MAVTGAYHHVHILSRDPDASAAWYAKALGGRVVKRTEHKGGITIQVALGESNLSIRGLRPGESAEPRGEGQTFGVHHLGVWVDDIEETIKQFLQAGGELLDPVSIGMTGNLVAFVKGPDGVVFEFLQPPRK